MTVDPAARPVAPLVSVCVPTYQRPDRLRRALASVTQAPASVATRVELVVSDNSTDSASERVYDDAVAGWPGPSRYVRHTPGVGMVGNFNACVALASGEYVLILHDDDYLLPAALPAILEAIAGTARHQVLLGGVVVVDHRDHVLKRQEFRSTADLAPGAALRRLLTDSSLVRFPAIVAHRDAYRAVGPFDESVGGATDFDMWSRLFARFGVRCLGTATAAYVVHPEAATTGVWNTGTVDAALTIFDRCAAMRLLDERALRRCRQDWFHQFVLSGTVRRLRARDRRGAARVLRLFDYAPLRDLGVSVRWLPVRVALAAVTWRADRAEPASA